MDNFEIFTDSSANLTDAVIDKHHINIVSLVFIVDGVEYVSYVKGRDNDLQKFYGMLREKKNITTSCVNEEVFYNAFDAVLAQGKDLLYIGFSSALSATYNSGNNAVERLKLKYPERKIYAIDTLGASIGEGLIVLHACEWKEANKTIEETVEEVEKSKLKMCHWFTVSDLFYLYRGGRVKKTVYYVANIINIKPVMHMDDLGRLVGVSNVIGRRKSLLALVDKTVSTIVNPEEQTIAICHGDCIEDVNFVLDKLNEKIKFKDVIINYVDPVVGAHSGPGTVSVFFFGTQR